MIFSINCHHFNRSGRQIFAMNSRDDRPVWHPFGEPLPESIVLLTSDGQTLFVQGLSSQVYASPIAEASWSPFGLPAGAVGQSLRATSQGLYVIGDRRILHLAGADSTWQSTEFLSLGVICSAIPDGDRIIALVNPEPGHAGAWVWQQQSRCWRPMEGAPSAPGLGGRATPTGMYGLFLQGFGLYRLAPGAGCWEPVREAAEAVRVLACPPCEGRQREQLITRLSACH